jgi:hypothetical protein
MALVRCYTGTDGQSHFEDLDLLPPDMESLTGCGKSRDFEKLVMKLAWYRNQDHIRSMGYGRAPVDEWQRNDDQSTFSAAC